MNRFIESDFVAMMQTESTQLSIGSITIDDSLNVFVDKVVMFCKSASPFAERFEHLPMTQAHLQAIQTHHTDVMKANPSPL